MIRKKLSTQKSKSGIYKTAKYFNKEEGCVLFESNIYTPLNASEKEIAKAISQSIESDMGDSKRGRKQSVRTQHDVVSFHTNDNLTPEQARCIAKELYEATHKLSNRKYALGVHIDTDEVHVHIVWSIKDFDGNCYNVGNDYRKIERECDKLENRYGLIKPENRIATDIDRLENHPDLKGKSEAVKKRAIANAINKKYSEKFPSSNERMLEIRGIISNKEEMKEDLKTLLQQSKSPSDFINKITDNGYNVIHNGKTSFSIQHEDQIFKASELGLSYKTLKAKLGEDTGFEQTLKDKHNIKEYEDCSIASTEAEPDYMRKIKPNSVLATKFKFIQHSDKVEYFYNTASSKKSFEYYKDPSKVSFHDLSRQSAKAGIQRLVADAKPPQSFTVNGPNFFKKNIWLEFQLMGLEAKGFKLEGYTPTQADLELVKKAQEQYASMNKKPEPKPEAPTVAVEPPKPVEPIAPPVMSTPVQNEPEQLVEPTKQVEQESNFDSLFDELEDEFSDKTFPVDSFKEILSKVTTDMLCVTHGSITCRICFGSNMENAPAFQHDEFISINHEIATAYADAGRALKEEFNQILSDKIDELKSTQEYQEKIEAAHIANIETDFHDFIERLIDKHTDYKKIEILRHVQDVLEGNGNIIPDAALYDDITEKVNQLDNHEREICSAYVQKLIDDDGSGAPIDGELKNADVKSKRKIRYKPC